jgi:putative sterol carrier protein
MSKTKDFFEQTLQSKIAGDGAAASSVGAIFLFNITGEGGGAWTVNLKDQLGVTPGDAGNSECTLECATSDWEVIAANPQAAMQLYFEGKLKVAGNVMLATKLQQILG